MTSIFTAESTEEVWLYLCKFSFVWIRLDEEMLYYYLSLVIDGKLGLAPSYPSSSLFVSFLILGFCSAVFFQAMVGLIGVVQF